ncbi:MAG: 3-hydroxyacyl-CoA dehydrogenase NAD-binding domain-containing protein [Deltaproteobacteria bacterium]|nr:3-hydroxyacyl-CoA dehydrogenase NAD-binding domain-containing protein [Deltaproteobacteria bacterium]
MKASEIKKVAVLGGSGMIGSSWTTNFLWRGLPVHVYDVSEECLKTARDRVRGNLQYLVNKGLLTQEKMNVALGLARYTTSMETAVKDVPFIQEAAPEKYDVKQALLAEVDRYAPAEAVFASSTSGLLITEIAKDSAHPERCLGAHPYNPPHLIPLIEISKGEKTSAAAVTLAYDFYRSHGKEPIILQKEALGFIANRLSVALYREAIDLVLKGVCSVEDIDKAVCFGPGLRYALMGPNLIYQLGGGPFGIKGIMQHIGPSVELWWADMADWKKVPPAWPDMAQEGVLKEMANRPEEQGKTPEEIARWRDDGLLALLKFLNKV